MPRRKRSEVSLRKLRSVLTNGTTVVLGDVDARSAWMRRLKDIIQNSISDFGGEENMTQAQLLLVRKAAMLELQTEMQERRWAEQNNGEASPKSLDLYIRATGSLRRSLSAAGSPSHMALRQNSGAGPTSTRLDGGSRCPRSRRPTPSTGTSAAGCACGG
jgi:hypothetical protein